MSSIADNIRNVRQRIQKATLAAGRPADSVHLLAVSKTRSADEIRTAAAQGLTRFGESYVKEALDKVQALQDLKGLEWHFIGPLQSNKTRPVAEHFDWVHSVDRAKVAERLNDQRPADRTPLNVCIQVNIDGEDTKSGTTLTMVESLADHIGRLPRLRLRGLMAIPNPDQSAEELRQRFATLRQTLDTIREQHPDWTTLDTLSMGMSDDLESAVAEGATIVRIGTALFGARPKPAKTSCETMEHNP